MKFVVAVALFAFIAVQMCQSAPTDGAKAVDTTVQPVAAQAAEVKAVPSAVPKDVTVKAPAPAASPVVEEKKS